MRTNDRPRQSNDAPRRLIKRNRNSNAVARKGQILVLALLLGVVLSGCLKDDEVGPEEEGPIKTAPVEGSGSINGTVATLETGFMENARVRLILDGEVADQTTTDAEGYYQIVNVEPQQYFLEIFSTCCKTHLERVEIVADQNVERNVVMERLNIVDRTVRGQHYDAGGFIGCTVVVLFQSLSCPDENHAVTKTGVADSGLRTVVARLEWDPTFGGAEQLRFRVINQVGTSYDYVDVTGPPPIEVRIDAEDLADAPEERQFEFYDDPERSLGLRFQVSPPEPASAVMNQRFHMYWGYHYWEPAPSDFPAKPE